MKDSTSFFGLGPKKIGLVRGWSETVSAMLFLQNINYLGTYCVISEQKKSAPPAHVYSS